MDLNIKLILIGQDYARVGQTYVISTNQHTLILPDIKYNNINLNLNELIQRYISLDINWINPKLLHVVYNTNIVDIYYHGHIPFDSILNDCYWLNITKLYNAPSIESSLVLKAINIL